MPWPFSESIKKRACRYLLQRYLGHFLQEKLSLEQLSLDLYQGTGSLAQVPLDKWVRAAGSGGAPGAVLVCVCCFFFPICFQQVCAPRSRVAETSRRWWRLHRGKRLTRWPGVCEGVCGGRGVRAAPLG